MLKTESVSSAYPLLSPPGGGTIFFQALLSGGGGAYLIYWNVSTGTRFIEDGLVVTGRYTAFSNNKKMVTILHRELERKAEKVQHMKLELMRSKTKNNMNFQSE